jgi:hypothetical protein
MERILHHDDAVLLDAGELVRKEAVAMFETQTAPTPHTFSSRCVDGIEDLLDREVAGDMKQ